MRTSDASMPGVRLAAVVLCALFALVQAQLAPDGLFVLWAGAQQVDWDLGAADRLRTAASTFSLRTPP